MNLKLFIDYGFRFIREFSQHRFEGSELIVVFEGDLPTNMPLLPGVKLLPFESTLRNQFLKYFSRLSDANGFRMIRETPTEDEGRQKIRLTRDFRYDAVRFSHKVFAVHQCYHSLMHLRHLEKCYLDVRKLVWIDADMRVNQDFLAADLDDFLPNDNYLLSYLGRTSFPSPNAYSECGWLGFNLEHRLCGSFINRVAEIYTTGELFSLQEWHDSWVWDFVRIEYEQQGVLFRDISSSASSEEHPMSHIPLGRIFDHLKGPERKALS